MQVQTFDIVTIGASAGGIEALKILLHKLPPDFPLPIAIVLHRSPREEDLLPRILGPFSALPVQRAEEGERLHAGVVYVAPSNRHLTISPRHTFELRDGTRINHTLSAIDPLFESAAHTYGAGAIAVVLTGGGSNGVHGARAVHDLGGTVIVQDPAQAAHSTMPHMSRRVARFVLPLKHIADALTQLATTGKYESERGGQLTAP